MKHTIFQMLLAVFFIVSPMTSYAQKPDGANSGFSGKLQAGGLFIHTDSQFSTKKTNRRIDDLNGPADPHELNSGLASAYLRYQFDNGTAIYAGNPLEAGEGLLIAAGVSHPMSAGILDVSVTWPPIEEIWKNPYQTVSPRDKTDVDAYGLRIKFQEVVGSPWEANYSVNHIDIENDEIGDLEADLKRSGWVHELGCKYTLPLGRGINLRPGLSFSHGDIEGQSNSYQGGKFEILLQKFQPPWVLIALVSASHNQYKKTHPLFNKTRHESGITSFAQVLRLNLFGVKRLFASAGAGYVWTDSNIDFFDNQTIIGLASVGVNF